MRQLEKKRVLVAGGTGDVGVGIVGALLAQGASVLVPVRSPDKAERLRTGLNGNAAGLRTIPGDVGSVEGAAAVAERIEEPLDGVVASLGGWWQGPALTEVDAATWEAVLANNLTSHFAAAKAFAPLLAEREGCYVQILGAAAEQPVSGSSLVSITAAAVTMMGRVMAAEHRPRSVTVRQIMIASLVATRARPRVDPSWITAEDVGLAAASILAEPDAAPQMTRLEPRSTPSG